VSTAAALEAVRCLAELGVPVRGNGPAEQRVACPRCDHGARDDALGVNIETGVYHCFRCGWSGRAGASQRARAGETRSASPAPRACDPDRSERIRRRLRQVWSSGVALKSDLARPVRQYLEGRGLREILRAPPAVLRAHPRLAYFDTTTHREVGAWPAMLALFCDRKGAPVTVHATYLRTDGSGKAPVASPKKILGSPAHGATRGGAIRLHEIEGGRLGIAEGIESALSLHLIRSIPVWSSYCADNLAAVQLPPAITELEIGVDVDESGKGERAARALASRILTERPFVRVRLITPDGEGPRDLNDEIRGK
jgi:putative DNA primase/helicase